MFVPVLNSFEGLSLTPKQWLNTKVTHFALDVGNLLQRPGYPENFEIKSIISCFGKVILDTRSLNFNTKGDVIYRSPDGAKRELNLLSLQKWLSDLDAEAILEDPRINWSDVKLVSSKTYDISNQAARDAFLGYVYQGNKGFSVLEPEYAMDVQVLALDCDCESCSQGVTRSYIHHLLPHTPLLAQRYLVIHNVRQMVILSNRP